MNNIKEKEINGKSYSIQLLPASVGLDVSQKIIKTVGPALGVILDSKEEFEFEESTFFTDLAIALTRSIDELDLINMSKALLKGSYCDTQEITFDTHFAGNYGELLSVLEFALKENFGDFFTSYLKGKGLEIHTLRQMMTPKKVEKQEELEEK